MPELRAGGDVQRTWRDRARRRAGQHADLSRGRLVGLARDGRWSTTPTPRGHLQAEHPRREHGIGLHRRDVREFDLHRCRSSARSPSASRATTSAPSASIVDSKGTTAPSTPTASTRLLSTTPDWFVAENVSGLSRANGGMAFGKILSALRRPGRAARSDGNFREFYGADAEAVDPDLEYELVANLYRFEEYGLPPAASPLHRHRNPQGRAPRAPEGFPGPRAYKRPRNGSRRPLATRSRGIPSILMRTTTAGSSIGRTS